MGESLATVKNLETGEHRRLGVRIEAVFPGSPAEKAGLQGMGLTRFGQVINGDIVLAIDDELIENPANVDEILSRHQSGDEVILAILRQDQALEVAVTLQ